MRRGVAALAAALLLGSAAVAMAGPEEGVMPLDQYTTAKARTLAATYQPQLSRLSEHIYHCLPWVGVSKSGIGFRQPKDASSDDSSRRIDGCRRCSRATASTCCAGWSR